MSKFDKLEEILDKRRDRVAESQVKVSLSELEAQAKVVVPRASFGKAVHQMEKIAVIAEMKRKSPSAGPIRPKMHVERIAESYEKGGAAALSVLTEPDFFGGDIADLKVAAESSDLPVLLKDFVFDPYQIVEAKVAGASAVLLIADMLPNSLLIELAGVARSYGLDSLVEVFSRDSLQPALQTGSKIIGINTRNLRTLEMDPHRVEELGKDIPSDCAIVAESGIRTAADMERLKKGRVSAVLIGESLLKKTDVYKAIKEIVKAGVR